MKLPTHLPPLPGSIWLLFVLRSGHWEAEAFTGFDPAVAECVSFTDKEAIVVYGDEIVFANNRARIEGCK